MDKSASIEGIILDIDGVIVGQRIGFNSPLPHPEILKALRKIRSHGIFISLSTAKPYFAIEEVIKQAGLDNLHIADGGSVLIDPINSKILKKHIVPGDIAMQIIRLYVNNNVYVEFYTGDNYFIQKSQISDITKKHEHILQKSPVQVTNLIEESLSHEITKIMPIAKNVDDKSRVGDMIRTFQKKITLHWGVHPVALPLQFGIITAPGISKRQGAIEIANYYHVPLDTILGVGDSLSDWEFIEICGYGGAMKNADEKLKKFVSSKKEGHYFIGGDVDNNGLLDILKFFKLV